MNRKEPTHPLTQGPRNLGFASIVHPTFSEVLVRRIDEAGEVGNERAARRPRYKHIDLIPGVRFESADGKRYTVDINGAARREGKPKGTKKHRTAARRAAKAASR